jgi:hypothetical protein
MDLNEAKRLKELERENGELKKMLAEALLRTNQQKVMPAIVTFFEAPTENIPIATTKSGYHPGEAR